MKAFLDEDSTVVQPTPPMIAASQPYNPSAFFGAVRVQLEAGADVNAKTIGDDYSTPPHVAVNRRIASINRHDPRPF